MKIIAFNTAIGEVGSVAISVGLLLVLVTLMFVLAKTRFDARSLAYAAICVGLAFVLNFAKLFTMPYGGSVTLLRMLPIVLYAYFFGTIKGIAAGAVYGLLDLLVGGQVVHPIQIMLDYLLGFAFIGLSGLFSNSKLPFLWGSLVATAARYLCVVISGAVFWGEYMPAEFDNVWVYSLVYSLYVIVDMALVIVVLTGLNFIPAFRKALLNIKKNGKEDGE